VIRDECDQYLDIQIQVIPEGGSLGDRWVTDPVTPPILASYMTYSSFTPEATASATTFAHL
jgi:hypothetical protein